MKLQDAIETCHVRSAIYRKSNPSVRYWKNSFTPLDQQVTWHWDRDADDWEEYDPRDKDDDFAETELSNDELDTDFEILANQ